MVGLDTRAEGLVVRWASWVQGQYRIRKSCCPQRELQEMRLAARADVVLDALVQQQSTLNVVELEVLLSLPQATAEH